jgi:signal transduction histidine kinase
LNFTAFVADGVLGPVSAEQAEVLNQSLGSGKHLLSLINDVLDITKIEAGMMQLFIQEVDFNEALAGTVSVARGLIKEKPIALMTEIEENLPTSFGDKRRLRQVFLNLISNAIKFTQEGNVTIEAKRTGNGIRVRVSDTGIGIASEDHALVFESFRQVNKHEMVEPVAGTGLGMPISKYFVDSHGGHISFESQPGVGTTFYVQLPVLTRDEAIALNASIEPVKE